MNAIKITAADIGRKIKNRSGRLLTIGGLYSTKETAVDGKMRVSCVEEAYIYHDDGKCPGVRSEDLQTFANTEPTSAITLEAGKYYRTRDGRKAFVAGEYLFDGNTKYPFAGFIEGYGYTGWESDGHFRHSDDNEGGDLVAEWVEPKRIKGWVNV